MFMFYPGRRLEQLKSNRGIGSYWEKVSFMSVPIFVPVPISVPIYTKNGTDNRYIVNRYIHLDFNSADIHNPLHNNKNTQHQ